MKSLCKKINEVQLPEFKGELYMLPFDSKTLEGLPSEYISLVRSMMKEVNAVGTSFLTLHGKDITPGDSHRRGGPHIDGNYSLSLGWDTPNPDWIMGSKTGGILLASNEEGCAGYLGSYPNEVGEGGDCSNIDLKNRFILEKNKVYYGNVSFIHESLPVEEDTFRVLARITLPEDHVYVY